jgi:hypothetical protein
MTRTNESRENCIEHAQSVKMTNSELTQVHHGCALKSRRLHRSHFPPMRERCNLAQQTARGCVHFVYGKESGVDHRPRHEQLPCDRKMLNLRRSDGTTSEMDYFDCRQSRVVRGSVQAPCCTGALATHQLANVSARFPCDTGGELSRNLIGIWHSV